MGGLIVVLLGLLVVAMGIGIARRHSRARTNKLRSSRSNWVTGLIGLQARSTSSLTIKVLAYFEALEDVS